jgi:hypothetical protein
MDGYIINSKYSLIEVLSLFQDLTAVVEIFSRRRNWMPEKRTAVD